MGPSRAPTAYLATAFLVHLCLLLQSAVSAAGATNAWRLVRRHARIDWRARVLESSYETVCDAEAGDALLPAQVEHVIVIPSYKEQVSTLRQTLDILASHGGASGYVICLAFEAREDGAAIKADMLMTAYAQAFSLITHTIHPAGVVGEVTGKAPNVAYCWRQLSRRFPVERRRRQVVHILDADAGLAADYFDAIACKFAAKPSERRAPAIWTPSLVFDRNCGDMPLVARLIDRLTCVTSLANCSPILGSGVPISIYSLSAELAELMPWDVGPQGIGEDCHVLVLSLLRTSGRVEVETICSPASLCSAQSDGYLGDIKARYRQLCRHLWGQLSSAVVLREVLLGSVGTSSKRLTWRAMRRMTYVSFMAHWSPVLGGLFLLAFVLRGPDVGAEVCAALPASPPPWTLSCGIVERTLDACYWIRIVCSVCSVVVAIAIDGYTHASDARWRLTDARARFGLRPADARPHTSRRTLLELPLLSLGVLYTLAAMFHVQVLQLWTDELTYTTSLKPSLLLPSVEPHDVDEKAIRDPEQQGLLADLEP